MLSLSSTTGYAIKALSCLEDPACNCRTTPGIAKRTGVPRPYLAKIVGSLARRGLVVAKRGIGGGITLARRPEDISLLQIVEAVEGKDWLGECLLGLDECSSLATCPTHDFWQRIRNEITQELGRITLASIIAFRLETQSNSKKRRSTKKQK